MELVKLGENEILRNNYDGTHTLIKMDANGMMTSATVVQKFNFDEPIGPGKDMPEPLVEYVGIHTETAKGVTLKDREPYGRKPLNPRKLPGQDETGYTTPPPRAGGLPRYNSAAGKTDGVYNRLNWE